MVVVVEDEPGLREVLCTFFEAQGWDVRPARHGGDVMDLLEGGIVPELIVTDLSMPVMGGVDLVTALRAHALGANVPVVVLTGRQGASPFASSAVQATLVKPFDLEDLMAVVRTVLGRERG